VFGIVAADKVELKHRNLVFLLGMNNIFLLLWIPLETEPQFLKNNPHMLSRLLSRLSMKNTIKIIEK
jgi:hypothetical protein